MDNFKEQFNQRTGLDYDTCTNEEYNLWYHDQIVKMSREDTYASEIIKMAEGIIQEKDYPKLIRILENYDQLVKEKWYSGRTDLTEYPYWAYAFGHN